MIGRFGFGFALSALRLGPADRWRARCRRLRLRTVVMTALCVLLCVPRLALAARFAAAARALFRTFAGAMFARRIAFIRAGFTLALDAGNALSDQLFDRDYGFDDRAG